MLKGNGQLHLSNIRRYLSHKYWFIGSTLFFLMAASAYLIFSPVIYNVKTRMVLNKQFPEEIITTLKSQALLRKTIEQLPLQIVYYYKETEIPEDSLPIKLIIPGHTAVNSSAEVKVAMVDNQQFKIVKDNVSMLYFFDQTVDFYSFTKFKIIKGPSFSTHTKPVTVRIYNTQHLVAVYNKNLEAKFVGDDHKIVELSIRTNSLNKGKVFLNKLVEVFNSANTNISASPDKASDDVAVKRISEELINLKAKAERFQKLKVSLSVLKETPSVNKTLKGETRIQFLNVLNAIQPYAQSPVDQFVLIPDSYHVHDSQLESFISQFNKMQIAKQHELQLSQPNSLNVKNLNATLSTVKQSIIQRIKIDKYAIGNVSANANFSKESSYKFDDSITKINSLIISKTKEYNNILQNEGTGPVSKGPNGMIVEYLDEHAVAYPKIIYVYFFALVIGLALPLLISYFKPRLNF